MSPERTLKKLAERVGFEPTDPFGSTVFETARFGHSRTSPRLILDGIHGGGCSQVLKKILQDGTALICKNSGLNEHSVVKACFG